MPEYSGGRASMHVRCAVSFKERVEAMAKARGTTVSDVCISALAEELQFFEFDQNARARADRDDWADMATRTASGEPV